MKSLELSNLHINIATEPDSEVCAGRYIYFLQNYMGVVMQLDTVDSGLFMQKYSKALSVDEKDIVVNNFIQSLAVCNQKINLLSECFCAISFIDNETNVLNTNSYSDKMKRMSDAGLTFETIKNECEGFFLQLKKAKKMM